MESGFDPAAEFLLAMPWVNLFEPTGDPFVFRCKGCGCDTVKMHERATHFNRHVGIRKRSETARQKRLAEQQRETALKNLEKAHAARARQEVKA